MINPELDGIDHINIYSKGRTILGRELSNFHYAIINTPFHGSFYSVEGYWYWLSCRDDRLRKVYGWEAKKLGRELKADDWIEDPEFKHNIKIAIRCKIYSIPHIHRHLIESSLPFKHYYVYGDKVIDETERCKWMIDVIEEIRNASKFHN